ncbi:hypothetical protein ACFE04_000943 [Oxalis oulophora]
MASASASVAVEKATSDLLIGPDWTMNIDICDSINSHHWQAKDIIKAVKKRLHHKNPKVQLLSLTLLETMVKNCGDFVHFQIADKNLLGEMVKIVKKKTDMQVRDKILVLLDSWQEAFGGPGGKHSQYYWAYDEIRRSGIQFPPRSPDAAPIFTPPVSHPTLSHNNQVGFGMPSNSSRRLDETMATESETITLSSLEAMRNVMDLLIDMLQAVNPNDRAAVKDEIIVDLVDRCRSNQKKLMQMLATTGDEELLGRGLDLNDSLQSLLARHDAIASGSPLPLQITHSSPKSSEVSVLSPKQSEASDSSPKSNLPAPVVATAIKSQIDEDEEEDDFALLARRHSKAQTAPTQTVPANSMSNGNPCMELALPDPPAPINTSKEQDMIDLLSLALTTTSTTSPPHTPLTPPPSSDHQTHNQVPINNGYANYQNNQSNNMFSTPRAGSGATNTAMGEAARPMQAYNSFPSSNATVDSQLNSGARTTAPGGGAQKPFIPSYRLFEDLNVLGNGSSTSSNISGSSGQSMVGFASSGHLLILAFHADQTSVSIFLDDQGIEVEMGDLRIDLREEEMRLGEKVT